MDKLLEQNLHRLCMQHNARLMAGELGKAWDGAAETVCFVSSQLIESLTVLSDHCSI